MQNELGVNMISILIESNWLFTLILSEFWKDYNICCLVKEALQHMLLEKRITQVWWFMIKPTIYLSVQFCADASVMYMKKLVARTKHIKHKCRSLSRKIKRIRFRIKIPGFARFRRRWLKFPTFSSSKRYTRLKWSDWT